MYMPVKSNSTNTYTDYYQEPTFFIGPEDIVTSTTVIAFTELGSAEAARGKIGMKRSCTFKSDSVGQKPWCLCRDRRRATMKTFSTKIKKKKKEKEKKSKGGYWKRQ